MSDIPPVTYQAPVDPEPVAPAARPNIAQVSVSVIVLLLWGTTIVAQLRGAAPLDAGTNQLLETAVTLVIGYWLGSSFGSAAKDAALSSLRSLRR